MILANFYPFLFLEVEGTTYKKQQVQIFNYLTSYMLMTFLWFIMAISSFFEKGQHFDESFTHQTIKECTEDADLENSDQMDFIMQVRILIRDLSYMTMLLSAGLTYGCFTGYQFSINFIVSVWGHEEVQSF